jgi:hypothetical protein
MKRIVFFIIVFAVMYTGLFAQERIAVFPFEDRNNEYTKDVLDSLYIEFSNEFRNKTDVSKFTVIPRQDVEKLINMETKFQLSDYSSKEKTAEMYRVLNAKQILYGLIVKVGNEIRISVSRRSFPELEVLHGGAGVTITNKNQIFDKIPELVQTMQIAMAEGVKDPPPPQIRNATLNFSGDTPAAQNKQTISSGLRTAIQNFNTNLELTENSNEASAYNFNIIIYINNLPSGLLQAEVTINFSGNGRVLWQTNPYYITETNEAMIARRISERLRADQAFFNKISEIVK